MASWALVAAEMLSLAKAKHLIASKHYDIILISKRRPAVVDILVRNVDETTAQRLKDKAAASGTSMSDAARDALTAYVRPSKAEAWAEIDRIRERIGKVSNDSTADIRADRDNDERYR